MQKIKITALSVAALILFLAISPTIKALHTSFSWLYPQAAAIYVPPRPQIPLHKSVRVTVHTRTISPSVDISPILIRKHSVSLSPSFHLSAPLSPTPTQKISTSPTPTQSSITSISLSEQQQFIMNKINDYRKNLGLSSVQSDKETCDFAQTRAQEIASSFNHDGFTNRINSHTLPYPSFHQVTENIAMTSNYQDVENMWANSPGHAENMRADTPYICVGVSGSYYAYEGWRP